MNIEEELRKNLHGCVELITLSKEEWDEEYPGVRGWTLPTAVEDTLGDPIHIASVCWERMRKAEIDFVTMCMISFVLTKGTEEDKLLACAELLDTLGEALTQ